MIAITIIPTKDVFFGLELNALMNKIRTITIDNPIDIDLDNNTGLVSKISVGIKGLSIVEVESIVKIFNQL